MSLGLLRTFLISDPAILLCTAVMGSISLAASAVDRSGRRSHKIAQVWARMILFAGGIKVRVEQMEKVPLNTGCVFVSNHLSLMDTPVVMGHIPAQFRFLAKLSLFSIPFIGTHLKRAGHIPVPLGDARASVRALSLAAGLIRKEGISVLVFPEGGRSEDGELQEFREGAAYIAIKAGAPLVPVALTGTFEILPIHSVAVRTGKVRLRVGDPIPTEGLKLSDRGRLTARLHAEVSQLLDRIKE